MENFHRMVSLSLLLLPSLGLAQPPVPTLVAPPPYSDQTLGELRQLHGAALRSDYALRQIAHLANHIGPRLTGSPQAQRAVEYVAGELHALGLEVSLEKIMVPHWVRGEETAALVGFPGMAENTTQRIVLTALGGSVATPAEGLTAEVVVARDFEELESLGREKVAGRIVLFNHRFDERMAAQGAGSQAYGQAVNYRGRGPSAAARLGAVAALVCSAGPGGNRLPHTGQTFYAKDAPQIPAGAVTTEDCALLAALAAEGTVRMRLLLTPQTLPDAVSYNVIGDLKGALHPEQIVIVSGHLDSWDLGTGALDDAAGVALAMEVAQLVKTSKLQPARTLRVIAWMSEENGQSGGKPYAEEHAAELPNHVAAIESDLGCDHPLGLNVAAKGVWGPLLLPISRVLDASGAGLINFTEHVGSDVDPLTKAGVPSFSPIQDARRYFEFHHTAADTFDKVRPAELAENAAVLTVTAYALANLQHPVPR